MWSTIAVIAVILMIAAVFPSLHQKVLEWKFRRALTSVGLKPIKQIPNSRK